MMRRVKTALLLLLLLLLLYKNNDTKMIYLDLIVVMI